MGQQFPRRGLCSSMSIVGGRTGEAAPSSALVCTHFREGMSSVFYYKIESRVPFHSGGVLVSVPVLWGRTWKCVELIRWLGRSFVSVQADTWQLITITELVVVMREKIDPSTLSLSFCDVVLWLVWLCTPTISWFLVARNMYTRVGGHESKLCVELCAICFEWVQIISLVEVNQWHRDSQEVSKYGKFTEEE